MVVQNEVHCTERKRIAITTVLCSVVVVGFATAIAATVSARACPPRDDEAKAQMATDPIDFEAAFIRIRQSFALEDKGAILREVFDAADDDLLNEMRGHHDNGIALTSAWETVRRTLPSEALSRPSPVKSEALNRFLGFVEGRLRVTVPKEWADCVMRAEGNSRYRIHFNASEDAIDFETTTGRRVSGGSGASEVNGQLMISVNGHEVAVPSGINSGFYLGEPFVRVDADKRCCYLSTDSGSMSPYSLHCVDLESGVCKWSKVVNVAWRGDFLIGMPESHIIRIVPKRNCIVVFGVTAGAAYIEGFRASDGRNLYRFNTRY